MAFGHSLRLIVIAAALAGAGACASGNPRSAPPGTPRPDQYLFDKGMDALKQRKWLLAREFLKQVDENYIQSPLRPDAKLGIGDTYLGEGSTQALVLGINEFEEFLSYYPTNARADYAQYQLAFCHFRQMRNPERDQTETRDTIKELDIFVGRYPGSSLLPEAKAKLREAHDRLSESDLRVGIFYFRIHWYPGAVDRLTNLLKQDPQFTTRDHAYFFLGESLVKMKRTAEALPLYEKLVAEFERSEHLDDAKKRIAELKAQAQAKES